jgi:hypothetical protein
MVSGCELGIVADRLLSLVGDDDRGALNKNRAFAISSNGTAVLA